MEVLTLYGMLSIIQAGLPILLEALLLPLLPPIIQVLAPMLAQPQALTQLGEQREVLRVLTLLLLILLLSLQSLPLQPIALLSVQLQAQPLLMLVTSIQLEVLQ